jgi:hypothetical protein
VLLEARTLIVNVLTVVETPDGVEVIKVLIALVTSSLLLSSTLKEKIREHVGEGIADNVFTQV